MLFKGEVLELRNATSDGRLHVARKTKNHDDWDPPYEPYDCYGPGNVAGDDHFDVV